MSGACVPRTERVPLRTPRGAVAARATAVRAPERNVVPDGGPAVPADRSRAPGAQHGRHRHPSVGHGGEGEW